MRAEHSLNIRSIGLRFIRQEYPRNSQVRYLNKITGIVTNHFTADLKGAAIENWDKRKRTPRTPDRNNTLGCRC